MPLEKKFLVKVFDQDNVTFLKTLSTEQPSDGTLPYLKANPTFSAKINGGYGQLVLDVGGWAFDDFEEGTSVDFLNLVDVYAVLVDTDAKTQTETRVYRGFVSAYTPYLQGGQEGVRVTCLGLASLLTASYYGTSPDYEVAHSGDDPEEIAQDVIDDFNGKFSGSLLSYTGTTSTVGTNVTKTFTERTWFQALDDAKNLAGEGWWWLVDANGQFYFQAKPVSATHTFTVDLDIQEMEAPKTMEKVKNEVIVERTGGTRTTYTDSTSQANFGTGSPATGRWTQIITDSTIGNETTADQRGEKALADLKDEKVSARLVINDRYASLDSIRPGQCVRIANFDADNSFFGDNILQIVSMNYQGDSVSLELEQQNVSFGQQLAEFVNA